MTLPYDIARCACWWYCPRKMQCARYTEPGRPMYQDYIDPSKTLTLGSEPCPYFIDNREGARK